MAVDGYRAHTDLRKKRRRPFHYPAQILIDKKGQSRPCSVQDISESGARIVLQKDEQLPKRFLLLLASRGAARVCREVWRHELIVGVEFVDSDRS